jgi:hypothetical protein
MLPLYVLLPVDDEPDDVMPLPSYLQIKSFVIHHQNVAFNEPDQY